VTIETTTYRGVVDRAAHRFVIYDGTRAILDEPVAVGKPTTPTPTGVFSITELLQPPDANGPYGPYAFGLSGRAAAGEFGLHGTNDPSSIGRDASNGCVRTTNDTIRRLASFLPLGTPITIG
jgi:lipoprotein-anchoring transpeptidase ErfK/SrfK